MVSWIIGGIILAAAFFWVLAVYQKAVLKGKARKRAAGE